MSRQSFSARRTPGAMPTAPTAPSSWFASSRAVSPPREWPARHDSLQVQPPGQVHGEEGFAPDGAAEALQLPQGHAQAFRSSDSPP